MEKPTSHDLLALDYADEALQTIVATLSCAHRRKSGRASSFNSRPRSSWRSRFAISSFGNAVPACRGCSLSRHGSSSRPCEVSRSLAGLLSSAVLTRLAGFAQEVCSACKVDCLNRIHADVSREFFALDHPGRK
jgi:hypothetical protein